MALTKCPECSNEVSDKATSCPKCGHPVQAPTPQPDVDMDALIKQTITRSGKITAIKVYLTHNPSAGLTGAKQYVENLTAELYAGARTKPSQGVDTIAAFFIVSFVILAALGGVYFWITSQPSASSAPITQPTATSPSVSAPPPEVPLSSISWSEINDIYNLKSKYTDLQKDEYWKQYNGKKIKWSGTVREVSQSLGSLSLQVKMNADSFTSDLLITLKDSQRTTALGLKQGDSVTFTGILDRWGSFLPITIKDGEILN
jgi:hypothetical protein